MDKNSKFQRLYRQYTFGPKARPHIIPTISEARINYIVVYRGTFNPPHIGHLNFLKDSLAHAGPDLHIIGAIVQPSDARWMAEHKKCDLVLSEEERSQLLSDDKRMPDSVLALRSYPYVGLASFQASVADLHVRVRFIQLLSTETDLGLDNGTQEWPVGFDGVLINTYGRHRDGTLPLEELQKEPWTSLHESGASVHRYHRMYANKKGVMKGFMRVITRGESEMESKISSSLIRNFARAMSVEEVAGSETLSKVVLSWSTLMQDETWLRWLRDKPTGWEASYTPQERESLEQALKEALDLEQRNFEVE
ncbi:hypothetical protein FB567DRAFT_295920 [Paraphoma chrysanthemicola]|uniref:Cytidyltransferase-like domain-containing protein n=1 Tax=Paraphoma chrysanthemicola TaxID=798071 RepID=A0A8K0W115_9PLEO|nr:hypothetical protein FB567DRAFT_295920 [Paraphoma chrysanthemicola]